MVRRGAFTLIELIFAIIIISIAVMSLPVMSRLLTNSIDTNLVQEAIFAAATELNEATTKHWDENSIDTSASTPLAAVINIDGTCEANNLSSRYRLRPGHIVEPYHRHCLNDLNQIEADTNTNNDVEAVEDSIHADQSIFLNPTPSQSGYKNNYTSSLTVNYDPSFAGAARPNLKQITVSIKNSNGDTLTSLNTYVANIGEVDYYKRSF